MRSGPVAFSQPRVQEKPSLALAFSRSVVLIAAAEAAFGFMMIGGTTGGSPPAIVVNA
jgi:hypothetical protein